MMAMSTVGVQRGRAVADERIFGMSHFHTPENDSTIFHLFLAEATFYNTHTNQNNYGSD